MKFHVLLQAARRKLNAGSEGTPTSIHMIGLSERGKPGTKTTPLQGAVDGKTITILYPGESGGTVLMKQAHKPVEGRPPVGNSLLFSIERRVR